MPEIIRLSVRWSCRYSLSDRDLEEMMQARGVEVDHATSNRPVLEYAPHWTSEFDPIGILQTIL